MGRLWHKTPLFKCSVDIRRIADSMRAISFQHGNPLGLRRLLLDTRSMVRHLVALAVRERITSAITLRKKTREWFRTSWRHRYAAAYHESACSTAVGIVRSYLRLKRTGVRVGEPRANRLRITLHQSLSRIKDGVLRVTVRPGKYFYFPLEKAMKHKRWTEWSAHKLGEVILTEWSVVLPFQVPEEPKLTAEGIVGIDLNLRHVDLLSETMAKQIVLNRLANTQSRFQRLRESIQRAIPKNLQRQRRVLRHYRNRQRNVVTDMVQKEIAPAIVDFAQGANIAFENLSKMPRGNGPSRDLRRKLSRWTCGLLQREVERRSPARVVYVNPRGTSQECPRCGGKVSHPAWRLARCANCGDFDRDRMASANIMSRGHRLLWGQPLAPSARASAAELARWTPERDSEGPTRPKPYDG